MPLTRYHLAVPFANDPSRQLFYSTRKASLATLDTASLCMADVDDALVIHHDGGLYKCPALIGHKQFQTGDIWRGLLDVERVYAVGHWYRQVKCRHCRYAAYQRQGNLAMVDCQYDYFEATLPDLLDQELRYRHSDRLPVDDSGIRGEG
jgi:radical SAM protein with 4Fe4S-binding SPASM domain